MMTKFQEQRNILGKMTGGSHVHGVTRLRQRLLVGRGQMPEFCFESFDKFTQHLLDPITLQNGEITTQHSSLESCAQIVHVSWLDQGKQF